MLPCLQTAMFNTPTCVVWNVRQHRCQVYRRRHSHCCCAPPLLQPLLLRPQGAAARAPHAAPAGSPGSRSTRPPGPQSLSAAPAPLRPPPRATPHMAAGWQPSPQDASMSGHISHLLMFRHASVPVTDIYTVASRPLALLQCQPLKVRPEQETSLFLKLTVAACHQQAQCRHITASAPARACRQRCSRMRCSSTPSQTARWLRSARPRARSRAARSRSAPTASASAAAAASNSASSAAVSSSSPPGTNKMLQHLCTRYTCAGHASLQHAASSSRRTAPKQCLTPASQFVAINTSISISCRQLSFNLSHRRLIKPIRMPVVPRSGHLTELSPVSPAPVSSNDST